LNVTTGGVGKRKERKEEKNENENENEKKKREWKSVWAQKILVTPTGTKETL